MRLFLSQVRNGAELGGGAGMPAGIGSVGRDGWGLSTSDFAGWQYNRARQQIWQRMGLRSPSTVALAHAVSSGRCSPL